MNPLSVMYVKAQIILGLSLVLGFFATLWLLVIHWHDMTPQQLTIVSSLVTVLASVMPLTLQSFFPKHTSDSAGGSDVPTTTINASAGTTVNHNVTGSSQPPSA